MIEGAFIINPIAHAYNLTDANLQPNPYGRGLRDLLVNLHLVWNPPHLRVPAEVYMSDWPVEAVARTLFLETDVDMAANMYLRLDSWFKDGLCSRAKNVEAATRWPERYLTYVGVSPTQGLDVCLKDLEEQMAELPNSIGLKLYPDEVEPFRSWRMDDPKLAYPLFERAQKLGIKTVAIHKAIPNGPVPMNPYRVDDVDGAAIHFPELNFEIVHAGLAFVDETAHAIARFHNVYANLEITSLLMHHGPGMFDEILAQFLFWGGPEKIIYSDGTLFCHTQPLLEKFWNLSFSDELMQKYNLKQLTKTDKALILGGNYGRIIGLDVEKAKARMANDGFARERQQTGIQKPFSNWLRMYMEEKQSKAQRERAVG
jgi:predicted TIM-barrel fold metal-dependent hydrolase